MQKTEEARIEAVKRFDTFNFDINANFHGLLKLASDIFETPVAFISLIDNNNQWFKVCHGFEVLCAPRATSFCSHTLNYDHAMIVPDASADERFADNPLVLQAPAIRFYAGAPLCTSDGHNIGTICVMDVKPKQVPDNGGLHLDILARQVINLMELELAYKVINEKMQQIELQNNAFRQIAHIQSHDFRGPLSSIMAVMNQIKEENYNPPKEYLQMMEQAINKLDEKVHVVVESTEIAENSFMIAG